MRLATAALVLATCGVHATEVGTRVEAFRDVERQVFERPQLEQEPIVRAAFQSHLADAYTERAMARASDDDLVLLLGAADALGFYSQSPGDLERVHRVLQHLERRYVATDHDRAMYFRGLLELRRFEDAAQFRAAHPKLVAESVPRTVDETNSSDGPLVYEVSAASSALLKKRRSLAHGIRLVVVSHPLCGFSRNAMQELAGDAALAPILQSHTTWVAPISRWLYFDELQTWNREHPSTPVVLADRREDWPFIRVWSTPTFHVLKDGKLVGFFEGWPKGVGRRPQLVELLRAAGLDVE